jgi:hypothetical protein
MVRLALLVRRISRIYLQKKQMELSENQKSTKNIVLYSNRRIGNFSCMGYIYKPPCALFLRPVYLRGQTKNIQLDRLHYSAAAIDLFIAHLQTVLQNIVPHWMDDVCDEILALCRKIKNHRM